MMPNDREQEAVLDEQLIEALESRGPLRDHPAVQALLDRSSLTLVKAGAAPESGFERLMRVCAEIAANHPLPGEQPPPRPTLTVIPGGDDA